MDMCYLQKGKVAKGHPSIRPMQGFAFALLVLFVFVICILNLSHPQFNDQRTTLKAGTAITANAGNNLKATAVAMAAGGSVGLSARNDIDITTREFSRTKTWNSCRNCTDTQKDTQQLASIIEAGSDLSASAGNDLTVTGSALNAKNNIQLLATGTTTLASALESVETHSVYHKKSRSGKVTHQESDSASLTHQTTTVNAGGDLLVNVGKNEKGVQRAEAAGDVNSLGARLTTGGESYLYGDSINLLAVKDLQKSSYVSSKKRWYSGSTHSTGSNLLESLQGSELMAGEDTALLARDDINIVASTVSAGNINLAAGLDGSGSINILGANEVSESRYSYEKSRLSVNVSGLMMGDPLGGLGKETTTNSGSTHQENYVGATLTARNDLNLSASQQLNVTGSTLGAEGAINGHAQDITITAGESTSSSSQQNGSGFNSLLSAYNSQSSQNSTSTTAAGSLLSGDRINLTAQNDLGVHGSQVVSTHDVNLVAGGNVSIGTVTETSQTGSKSESNKKGVFGEGLSTTLGQQKQRLEQLGRQSTEVGSVVGTSAGTVNVQAGGNYTQRASDVIGTGGIAITASEIRVEAGASTYQSESHERQRQAGFTSGISSPILTAAQSAKQAVERSDEVQDERLKNVLRAKAALETAKAVMETQKALADGAVGVKASVSVGASSSRSDSTSSGSQAIGSSLQSSGDIALKATGNGETGSGDLAITGAQVNGNNVSLSAADALVLQSAQNTSTDRSSNKSSGGSIGVGLALGGTSNGFTIDIAAQMAKGRTNGDSLTHTESVISAANQLSLNSGGDTTLKGAQARGEQITATVGGNLNLESQQDKETYDSKQQSGGVGISICVPPICAGSGSVSGSYSKDKISNNYASVIEQTGFFAGTGGFDITVGGNTDLKGAVIASEANAEKNTLSTETLTHSDIQNKADWSADSVGLSLSTNPQAMALAALGTAANALGSNDGDSQTGTTQSAIGAGTIIVRQDAETGDDSTQGLSRDTAHANDGTLTSTFDAQAIRERQELTRETLALGASIVTELDKGLQARKQAAADKQTAYLNAIADGASPEERESLRLDYEKAQAGYDSYSDTWGRGGTGRQIIQAATFALGGNPAGAISELATQAAVNFVAAKGAEWVGEQVNQLRLEEGSPAHVALHALIGCGQGAASGNCSAGAIGASTAVLLNDLMSSANDSKLTEQEKSGRRDLVAALSGIVAGAIEGDLNAVQVGGQAAMTETENNKLSWSQRFKQAGCYLTWDATCVQLMRNKDISQEKAWQKGSSAAVSELGEEFKNLPESTKALIQKAMTDPVATLQDMGAALAEMPADYAEKFKAIANAYFTAETDAEFEAAGKAYAGLMLEGGMGAVTAGAGAAAVKGAEKISDFFKLPGLNKMPKVDISANGTNISARKITENGLPVEHKLSPEERKLQEKWSNASSSSEKGKIGEELTTSYFERNGYKSLPGKCGSDNCFDGVFVKDGQVYIVETKPLNPDGSIKLNSATSTLPSQMSDGWINDVMRRLRESPETIGTFDFLRNHIEGGGTISKVAVGVNGNNVVLVPLK